MKSNNFVQNNNNSLSRISGVNINNSEYINNLEREFFINRNFEFCLKEINSEFDKLKSKETNNRHKCLRNPLCNCNYLGKFLIEIFSSNQEEFAKQFENYFYCCPIYLPFELFMSIIYHMLNYMEFSTARVWIEAYLTYSMKEENKIGNIYAKNNKLVLSSREVHKFIKIVL